MRRSLINKVAIARMVAAMTLVSAAGIANSAPAQAQVVSPEEQLSISMTLLPGESYEDFVERAEEAVEQQVQRFFQRSAASSVLVIFNGQNAGLIAPVLELSVTRTQWTAAPETEQWATYFPGSDVLLGIAEPAQPEPPVAEGDAENEVAEEDTAAEEVIDAPASEPADSGVTISVPTGNSEAAGSAADEGPVQPQTSTTTPESNVAPLEVTPNAGTTANEDVVDFEDSNDFETVPGNSGDDLVNDDGAIQPQTTFAQPEDLPSDDAEVIVEPD
ncbi:MAG: hypothetical protein ACFB5Z_19630 [Elainellaceae cyanobacterium]